MQKTSADRINVTHIHTPDAARQEQAARVLADAARERDRAVRQRIVDIIKAGDWGCLRCGHVAPESQFKLGRGRQYGQHPEHHYCQECGASVTWYGRIDGRLVAIARGERR